VSRSFRDADLILKKATIDQYHSDLARNIVDTVRLNQIDSLQEGPDA